MTHRSFPQLRALTDFSFRRGASTISSLVAGAVKANVPALAITDLASMSGVMAFSDYASSKGIQPIIGCDLKVVDGGNILRSDKMSGHIVLLAMNEIGYINICKILEKAYTPISVKVGAKESLPSDPFVSIDYLCEHSEGVILLSGIQNYGLGYQLATHRDGRAITEQIYRSFGSCMYIEICRYIGKEPPVEIEDVLFELADGLYDIQFPVCATVDIQYAMAEDASTWHLLRASRDSLTVVVDEDGNVEQDSPGMHIPNKEEFETLFEDVPDAIENTIMISSRCGFMVEKRSPILPNYPVPEGETTESHLLNESLAGLKKRMENHSGDYNEYEKRLRFEIDVINKMGFPGYFLIVSDFIQWAKDHFIPVGPGRGSGAGSVVAWSLRITDVDPIKHGLLFERFLNPERVSMPDFDVDFCTNRRNEVIEYVRKKYGEDHVCMIATFGKELAKTAIDDVQRCIISDAGYAMGRQEASLLKMPFNHLKTANMSIEVASKGGNSDIEKEQCIEFLRILNEKKGTSEDLYPFLNAAKRIEGLSRNQSQHAAGVVIGDRPLSELFPIIRDEKNLSSMSAFAGKYVEMAGGVKFDFLALKNLTIIDEAMKIAKSFYGSDIIDPRDLDDFDNPEYEGLYRIVREVKTVGLFQIASPGMGQTLMDVGPTEFADIVAILALYRPGPMDIIPDYAARKRGEQEIIYPCEKFTKPILEPTYGFMVYQEQVMQIAMACAGYTLGGADLLRRAMGKKIREEMEKQRAIFVAGCAKNDISEEEANNLFDTISKFADYGFNKSHAVAYAIVAWQTMYMKYYYPECFYAALIALSPDAIPNIVAEMKTMKPAISLLHPDVNVSQVDAYPLSKDKISCGLAVIPTMKNMSEKLIMERNKNGIFKDIVDFGTRMGQYLPIAAYKHLAEAGALDCLWKSKDTPVRSRLAVWAEWFARGNRKKDERQGGLFDMFDAGELAVKWPSVVQDIPSLAKEKELKDIPVDQLPEWIDKDLRAMKALGFWINGHPLLSKVGLLTNLGCRPFSTWNIILKTLNMSSIPLKPTAVVVNHIEEKWERAKDGIPTLEIRCFDGLHEMRIWYNHFIPTGDRQQYVKNKAKAKEKYQNIRNNLQTSLETGCPVIIIGNLLLNNNSEKQWNDLCCKCRVADVIPLSDVITNVTRDWTIILEPDTSEEDYEKIVQLIEKMENKDENRFGGCVNIVLNKRVKNFMTEQLTPKKFWITDEQAEELRNNKYISMIFCPSDVISNPMSVIIDDDNKIDGLNLDYKSEKFEQVLQELVE